MKKSSHNRKDEGEDKEEICLWDCNKQVYNVKSHVPSKRAQRQCPNSLQAFSVVTNEIVSRCIPEGEFLWKIIKRVKNFLIVFTMMPLFGANFQQGPETGFVS